MKVFRGIVLGLTVAFFILAILALMLVSTVEMCRAVIVGAIIIVALNIISMVLWLRNEKLMFVEMKWAGIKFHW